MLIQKGLSMLVDRNSFSVSTTSTIENGINLIKSNQVDCIIINWYSPHLCQSAWQLALMIRQSCQKGRFAKIVFTMDKPTLQAIRLSEILEPIAVISLPKTKEAFSSAIVNSLASQNKLEHPRINKSIDNLDALSLVCPDTLMKKFSYQDIIYLLKTQNLSAEHQMQLLRVGNSICPFDLWIVTKLIDSNRLTSIEVIDVLERFYSTAPKVSHNYRLKLTKLNIFCKQRNIHIKRPNY